MALINIDLDGVVYPFHDVYREWLIRNGYDEFDVSVAHFTAWEMWDALGMSYGEWQGEFRRGVADGYIWEQGEPIEDSKKYLWKLSDDGHNLRIVTRRLVHKFNHARSVETTVHWLDRHNIPYHDIVFIGFKHNKEHYPCDFAIDDNPEHVAEQLRNKTRAYLFSQPWNQKSTLPRVNSWKEFYEQITEVGTAEPVSSDFSYQSPHLAQIPSVPLPQPCGCAACREIQGL